MVRRREAAEEPTLKQRLLRYGVVALAALAVAQGVRTWQAAGRDVTLIYSGGAGEMHVKVLDEEGAMMRRVTFAPGVERRHTVQLPDGTYKAVIDAGGRRKEAWFRVDDGVSTVELPRRE